MENYRLWGRIIKNHRIDRQATVDIHDGDVESAFLELCHAFDIQRPVQLPKHNRDWDRFGRTFYSKEHFTESISFEKFEVELLLPEGQKHSSGERHPLMDA